MSQRHDDADPVEHDPTGMRALLGSLPDPGPMPDRLVARITAALEEESRTAGAGDTHTAGGWVPPPAPGELASRGLGSSAPDDGTVVPLRRRRAPWLIGAAAAAVLAVVAGGALVDRLSPGGLQASLGLDQGAADSAGGAAPESATESGESGGDATAESSRNSANGSSAGSAAPDWTPTTADPELGVRILDGSQTSSPSLGSVLAGLAVPAYSAFPTDSGKPLQASRETVGWPGGARDCATGLGVPRDTEVVVVLTDVQDSRAAVVVALEPDGVRRGWVVGPTCSSTDPDVLAGPATRG